MELEPRVEKLEHVVYGNGTTGAMEELRLLRRSVEILRKEQDDDRTILLEIRREARDRQQQALGAQRINRAWLSVLSAIGGASLALILRSLDSVRTILEAIIK